MSVEEKLDLAEQVDHMTGRQLRSALQVICGYDPSLAEMIIAWGIARHPEPTAWLAEHIGLGVGEEKPVMVSGQQYVMRREQ
jgi:hypothetical protein